MCFWKEFMSYFKIEGGLPLHGEITLSGSKNAALPILAASLLTDKPISFSNVPNISDIQHLQHCLAALGKSIHQHGMNQLTLYPLPSKNPQIPESHARMLRGSILLLGPLIARHKKVVLPLPGGCSIGKRPIDQHIMALQALGVDVVEYEDRLECTRQGPYLIANSIHFSVKTVTGTENAIMAAVLAKGVSTISNAASEPEVEDLIKFLNMIGAKILWKGEGLLEITGVKALHGYKQYTIMGDRIEAGTFLVAAAITGGSISINGVAPEYLESCLTVLKEIGASIVCEKNTIHLDMKKCAKNPFHLVTQPYPGFPTDLQSLFLSLATTLHGESSLCETLFENRFQLVKQMQTLGATIRVANDTAYVSGSSRLNGGKIRATDLRSGAALVCAALAAEGVSLITDIHHILRGYQDLTLKLTSLGAKIIQVREEIPTPISIVNQGFFGKRSTKREASENQLLAFVSSKFMPRNKESLEKTERTIAQSKL